MAQLHG